MSLVSLWCLLLCASVVNPQVPPIELRVGLDEPGGGYTITTLALDTYVARVLAGEAARDSPPAALEALAITVRTFALANRDRHRADGFDLCDDTHCQVLRTATAATERAAKATAGQVLTRGGVVASVFYSASCGGRTESPSDVWPGADDPSYLPIADDDACQGAPAWDAELSDGEMERALRAAGFRGDHLRELRVASKNASGRVAQLKVDGLDAARNLRPRPARRRGPDARLAVFEEHGVRTAASARFVSLQRSWIRARGGAVRDWLGQPCGSRHDGLRDPREVFSRHSDHRRRTTDVSGAAEAEPAPVPSVPLPAAPVPAIVSRERADVTGVAPGRDEGERRTITALTVGARDDIARLLGVTAPMRVSVRFHPTTDDYSHATASPGSRPVRWSMPSCTCRRLPSCANAACSNGPCVTSWCA